MTEPNQVRPIMKILNQVRELIIDAHNAGEQKGIVKGRKEVLNWLHSPCPHTGGLEEEQMYAEACPKCWQAKRKEWGIE